MSSDTPRTDSEAATCKKTFGESDYRACYEHALRVARAHERELTAANAEIARLREALDDTRDTILNGRHELECVLDSDQTNAVLSVFDSMHERIDAALKGSET